MYSDGWKTLDNGVKVYIQNGTVTKGPQALINRNASSSDVKKAKQSANKEQRRQERLKDRNAQIKKMSDTELFRLNLSHLGIPFMDLDEENKTRMMSINREKSARRHFQQRYEKGELSLHDMDTIDTEMKFREEIRKAQNGGK